MSEKDKELEKKAKDLANKIREEIGIDSSIEDLKKQVGELNEKLDAEKTGQIEKVFVGKDVQKEVDKLTKEEACDAYAHALFSADKGAIKALSEGTDADGGYVVHDEFYNRIMEELYEETEMRQYVTVVPMNSQVLNVDVIENGPEVYWTSEGAKKTTTTAEFRQPTLTAYKLAAIIYMTDELIEDSAYGLTDLLVRRFAQRMAEEEDAAIINGSGTGQPEGIFQNASISARAVAGNLSFDDIIDLIYDLPKKYRRNGVFLVNGENVRELRKLKDGDNRYLWQDPVAAGQPATIQGYPVVENNEVPVTEIGFGDWKTCYMLGDRQRMSVKITNDTETTFTEDKTAIRVVRRIAGVTVFPNAARKLNSIP